MNVQISVPKVIERVEIGAFLVKLWYQFGEKKEELLIRHFSVNCGDKRVQFAK